MSTSIGYTNLVKTGTVTVTSEASGFEKENAQSYKTSTWWKASAAGTVYFTIDMGSAVTVDSWGIIGHNLFDNSGTIKAQYSSDNFAADTNDLDTVQTPSANIAIFRKATSRSARYYRFEIASTGSASFIGNFFLGAALDLPNGMTSGFSPASLNRDRDIFNNMTQGGNYTGRILRSKGSEVSISQRNVTRAWVDSNWAALADHIELYPFYFAWDTTNFPADAAYCMAQKINYPSYSDNTYMRFNIDCVAIYDV